MFLDHPSEEVLLKYAKIFTGFALRSGNGVQPGDVVYTTIPDVAKPMYGALQEALLRAGANPLLRLVPTGFNRQFYQLARAEQLDFFPEAYFKGLAEVMTGRIHIVAEADKHELEGIPADKIMRYQRSFGPFRTWLNKKEIDGNYTWTLGLYGTPTMAAEVKMSLEDYWGQIILACFLDAEDPVAEWRKVQTEIDRVRTALNRLEIDRLHVEAEDIDLRLTLGLQRQWVGGTGRNIPSFEIFTSPDWRGVKGHISFNQPLYYSGTLISGIHLVFKNGQVVEASADQGEPLLKEMLAQPNANKIGEFSLTSKISRITRFMGTTLYDENVGGPRGNTHIAVGMSYTDAFAGDAGKMSEKDWQELGFNDTNCPVHTDMISTADRTVTATLRDGSRKVIYQDGNFTV